MRKNYDLTNAKRGPVTPVSKGKIRITIRLDENVLDWFREQVDKAGGGNYQSLINDALQSFVASRKDPIENVVRRVVREELKKVREPRRSRGRTA